MRASGSRRPLGWMAAALALVAAHACKKKENPPSPAQSSSSPVATASASTDDEVRPVYPLDGGAPDPKAERFCRAVQGLPAERRAACCSEPANTPLVGQCVRMLSFAIQSDAIRIDDARLGECVEATAKAHAGCDWVGNSTLPMPDACGRVFQGQLPSGAACRSSLECRDELFCRGLSATGGGRCSAPLPADGPCGLGIDPLASLARQADARSECAGFCARPRCQESVAMGAACKTSSECGKGKSCTNGTCATTPLARPGESCKLIECDSTALCVEGKCVAPKREGEACRSNRECLGTCEKSRCVKQCRVSLDISKIPALPSARGRR